MNENGAQLDTVGEIPTVAAMTPPRMTITAEGKIGLNWPGKGQFEPRPARGLIEVAQFATPDGGDPERNLVVAGDARDALPALRSRYARQARLIYVDPPFATGQMFDDYDDRYERSLWLNEMYEIFGLLEKFLHPDGTLWVHLDYKMSHYAKVMLDSIFGYDRFVGEVIWQKADSPRMDAKQFSTSHDYILVYSPNPDWQPTKLDPPGADASFTEVDAEGRRFRTSPLRKWGKNSLRADRPNLWYPITAPDDVDHPDAGKEIWPIKPDGAEGNWRWKPATVEANHQRIAWLDKGSGLQPYVIAYEDEQQKRPPETLWLNSEVGHNREAKAHLKRIFGPQPFDTPKPERLLERILKISTDEDDLVLDCFAGSGTTGTAAHKMGRRFVLVERQQRTANEFIVKRLKMVMTGEDRPPEHAAATCLVEQCPDCGSEIDHIEAEETAPRRRRERGPTAWPGAFTLLEIGDAIARRDSELHMPVLSREYRSTAALVDLFVGYSEFERLTDEHAAELGIEPGLFHAVKERRIVHFADAIVDAAYLDDLGTRLPAGYSLIVYVRRAVSDLAPPNHIKVVKVPRDFLRDLNLRPAEATWRAPVFDEEPVDDESVSSDVDGVEADVVLPSEAVVAPADD